MLWTLLIACLGRSPRVLQYRWPPDKPALMGTFQAQEETRLILGLGAATTRGHQGRNGQRPKSLVPYPATLALGPWSSAHRQGGQGRRCSPSEAIGSRGLYCAYPDQPLRVPRAALPLPADQLVPGGPSSRPLSRWAGQPPR